MKNQLRALTAGVVGVVMALSVGATLAADTFKLYINKSANPDNVIILKDNAQTLITHTTEGIELEFPGVDIKFRCQSNVDGTADTCTIAVKEGVTTFTGSSSSSSSGSSTSSGSTSSSGSSTSSGSTSSSGSSTSSGSTSSSGSSTSSGSTSSSGSSSSGGSATCESGGGVVCSSFDFGPAGKDSTGATKNVYVDQGAILAMKFTMGSQTSGSVVSSEASLVGAVPTNGATIRYWISASPGEKQYLDRYCYNYGANGDIKWSTTGTSSRCPLSGNKVYWLNAVSCTGTDLYCSSSSQANTRHGFQISSSP